MLDFLVPMAMQQNCCEQDGRSKYIRGIMYCGIMVLYSNTILCLSGCILQARVSKAHYKVIYDR